MEVNRRWDVAVKGVMWCRAGQESLGKSHINRWRLLEDLVRSDVRMYRGGVCLTLLLYQYERNSREATFRTELPRDGSLMRVGNCSDFL